MEKHFLQNLSLNMYEKALRFLLQSTSVLLPSDIREALILAKNSETEKSTGKLSLEILLKNIFLAKKKGVPLCQDTGFPTFFVRLPKNISAHEFEKSIHAAIKMATEEGMLRPNAVDSLTGENSPQNIGEDLPKIFWEYMDEGEKIEISLLLKGGGSENVSGQVSLPMQTDFGHAKRDLDGIKKAVLQIVKNAQGKGCAPGILGIHIGSDRAGGYFHAKKNLLLSLGTENTIPELAQLEAEILREANAMEIGPMGFGGRTTLLGATVSASHRIPASFFVTVAYACWALRRGKIVLDAKTGEILDHSFSEKNSLFDSELHFEKVKKISFPCKKEAIENLELGDIILVSGTLFTGRDRVHEYALSHSLPKDLTGGALYHCGPIAIRENEGWNMISAGPTTSIREEDYEAEFIEKTGVKAIIGKGGMGKKTQEALQKHGAVYLHAIGGAAAFYAEAIKRVRGVDFLEAFGMPEALWELEVEDFLCVVTMNGKEKQ